MRVPVLSALFILLLSAAAAAHEKGPHETKEIAQPSVQKIGEEYDRLVQPIFRSKCFDCHSDQTRYPWYYPLPFVRWLIDRDIREAREHMDMSWGFPFRGHGSPSEDLEEIRKVVIEGTMPPWRYRLLHRNSRLTEEEKETILRWVKESL